MQNIIFTQSAFHYVPPAAVLWGKKKNVTTTGRFGLEQTVCSEILLNLPMTSPPLDTEYLSSVCHIQWTWTLISVLVTLLLLQSLPAPWPWWNLTLRCQTTSWLICILPSCPCVELAPASCTFPRKHIVLFVLPSELCFDWAAQTVWVYALWAAPVCPPDTQSVCSLSSDFQFWIIAENKRYFSIFVLWHKLCQFLTHV